MDLNLLGWIITMNNLHALGGPKYQLKDLSVEVDTVSKLKETILQYPGFSIDNFKDTAFHRSGDIAIFLSTSLRNYLNGLSTNPDENSLLIVLMYEPRQNFDLLNVRQNEPYHFFLANKNIEEDLVKKLLQYADNSFQQYLPESQKELVYQV